jgi:uncharacterized Zn finger protein
VTDRRDDREVDRALRLAASLVDVLMATVADPGRLRRGRGYARQGAVVALDVTAGAVRGEVQGSDPTPYRVQVRCGPAGAGARTPKDLVPDPDDVSFECTCADWEAPCKHAVAVMAELSRRVAHDVSLLATWRSRPGSTLAREAADPPPVTTPVDDDRRAALRAFLGEPAPSGERRAGARPAPLAPPAEHVDEPWTVMLAAALRILHADHR